MTPLRVLLHPWLTEETAVNGIQSNVVIKYMLVQTFVWFRQGKRKWREMNAFEIYFCAGVYGQPEGCTYPDDGEGYRQTLPSLWLLPPRYCWRNASVGGAVVEWERQNWQPESFHQGREFCSLETHLSVGWFSCQRNRDNMSQDSAG